jgi:Flp pilus assembly protein TadD
MSESALVWSRSNTLLVRVCTVSSNAPFYRAAVPSASQPPADRERFERAAAEFIAAQRLNADRPEARSALATFYARRGLASDAETEYKAALRLSPRYTLAAINLADLYRQLGRDGEGESVLRAAIAASSQDAGCITRWVSRSLGSSGARRRSRNCAAPPNSIPSAQDMRMFMPSGCIRPGMSTMPWRLSRRAWPAIPAIATPCWRS